MAITSISAALPLGLAQPAHAGPPGGWDPIIECESGGRNIPNAHSSASGYFQFLDGTWRDLGGGQFSARAMGASFNEQMVVAERAFARNGLSDWEASRSCWAGKTSASSSRHSSNSAAPKHAKSGTPRHARPDVPASLDVTVYTVRKGDTLSMIAERHGTTWPKLYKLNRDSIQDPDLIFPGEVLKLS